MSLRTDRVASLLKEELGVFFTREFRDPAYGLITLTEVHVSPDIRLAKIYVSILGDKNVKQRTLALLEDRKSEIRSFIGSHIRLKFTPSVQIYLDETLDRVQRIEELIKEIHKSEPRPEQK